MELGGGEAVFSGWSLGVPETVWGSCLCMELALSLLDSSDFCLSLGNDW